MFKLSPHGSRVQNIEAQSTREAKADLDDHRIVCLSSTSPFPGPCTYCAFVFVVSEEKIDHIDKTLARLGCSVDKLQGSGSISPRPTDVVTPPHAHRSSAIASTSRRASPDASSRVVPVVERDTRPANSAKDQAESEVLIEGQSSFTAHCEFAIGFLHNVVGSRQAVMDDGSEITGLLDTLHHILDAFHLQRLSPNKLFPLAKPVSDSGPNGCQMPPLESVFAVIYKAQGYSFPHFAPPSMKDGLRASNRGEQLYVPQSFSPSRPASSVRSVLEAIFLG